MTSTGKFRVVFTFDDESYEALMLMQDKGNFSSKANVVRDALVILRAFQKQIEQGFSEIIVRNPRTGEEKVALMPTLVKSSK